MSGIKGRRETKAGLKPVSVVLLIVVSCIMLYPTTGSDVTQTTIRNSYIVNPDNVTISMDGNITSVLIGQNVQFLCDGDKTGTVTVIGVEGTPAEGNVFTSNSTGWLNTEEMPEGLYNATYGAHWELLRLETPVMDLRLKVNSKEVVGIVQGTPLSVDFVSNLDENDCVDLVVRTPEGYRLTQNPADPNQKFDDINVSQLIEYGSENESKRINTRGWDVGAYTFSVRTEKENARGLKASSSERTLAVLKPEISINTEKSSVVELEKVMLTVRGAPNHNITINSSNPTHTIFPAGYEDNPSFDSSGFNDTLPADGQRKYVVYFNDTGTYTITVTDTTAQPHDSDNVDISVEGVKITFDVPTEVIIGEKFKIRGTAYTGETVDIAVEDYVYPELNDLLIDKNGVFEREIDTATTNITPFTVPGSVKLEAYIDRAAGAGYVGENETADGCTAIRIIGGDLTAELSTDKVAQGEKFTINGTARGVDNVDIVIIAPKGGNGSLIVSQWDCFAGHRHLSCCISRY